MVSACDVDRLAEWYNDDPAAVEYCDWFAAWYYGDNSSVVQENHPPAVAYDDDRIGAQPGAQLGDRLVDQGQEDHPALHFLRNRNAHECLEENARGSGGCKMAFERAAAQAVVE